MAQDNPFGSYDPYQWGNNMSLTGYVRMNGEILGNETVVAAYCGDELRGKDYPMDDGDKKSILYLDIYGDIKGRKTALQGLYRWACHRGGPGLTFTANGLIGFDDTYYIDLPAPVVTTPTKEGWATTCLPFNAEVPEGVTVWNATGISNGELLMTKATGTILPANTPVLLQSTGLASYEWLARVADGDIATTGCIC
jgi:hypothetical protein